MPDTIREKIALRVRELRKLKKMTQFDFAELTGLSVEAISAIERGKVTASLESLERIAEAVHLPLLRLMDFDKHVSPEKNASDALSRLNICLKQYSTEEINLLYNIALNIVNYKSRRGMTNGKIKTEGRTQER